MQPWQHFAQPTGQQEQQLFLQEVHLQEPEQDPSEAQEQLGVHGEWRQQLKIDER